MNYKNSSNIRTKPCSLLSLVAPAVLLLCLSCTTRGDDHSDQDLQALVLPTPTCDSLQVPSGNKVSYHAYALGVQIYRWSGATWTFIAPEAALYADRSYEDQVGTHYAGPTWESNNGSKVTGARVAACTPYRGAIPWLLLGGTSAPVHGKFEGITYIQRVNTIGGSAPAEAGAFVGDEARVPYTAEYYFYREKK